MLFGGQQEINTIAEDLHEIKKKKSAYYLGIVYDVNFHQRWHLMIVTYLQEVQIKELGKLVMLGRHLR